MKYLQKKGLKKNSIVLNLIRFRELTNKSLEDICSLFIYIYRKVFEINQNLYVLILKSKGK